MFGENGVWTLDCMVGIEFLGIRGEMGSKTGLLKRLVCSFPSPIFPFTQSGDYMMTIFHQYD